MHGPAETRAFFNALLPLATPESLGLLVIWFGTGELRILALLSAGKVLLPRKGRRAAHTTLPGGPTLGPMLQGWVWADWQLTDGNK